MRHRSAIATLIAALALAACGGADDTGDVTADPDAAEDAVEDALDEAEDQPELDVDREAVEAEARALLGRAEDEITEDEMTRVLRRGEEEFAGTMDLRPGRMNLELDDDGSGTYVVSRVTVEVSDGDPIVVE
jgi:hypothetical protein